MNDERNIGLIIRYKGTHYAGWQRQQNALGIEAVIRDAICDATGEHVTVYGAGRTDAGVHARAQRANFKTRCRIPADRVALAINARLPRDIRIMKSAEVPMTFHSRFDAAGKIYTYRIYAAPVADPFIDDFCWHTTWRLDIDAMRKATKPLIGEHDFKTFMAARSEVKTTVRRIDVIDITQKDHLVTLRFQGNGFLYNMVRIITGTLFEIAAGKKTSGDMQTILDSGDRSLAGPTAPARGLVMERVLYRPDPMADVLSKDDKI